MSISPIPKNRSRSRSNSPHSTSYSSRSSSSLSSRSASPKANPLTRSPGWSSKQSKKSNILSESKKICYNNGRASNKISSTRSSPPPSSSKSMSLKLSRSFECNSKEVHELKTSSKCNYINGTVSNKNKFPMDNAEFQRKVIFMLTPLSKKVNNLPQVIDNETATVHSVTKVDSMEEFNDLEESHEDQSEYAALVKSLLKVGGKDAKTVTRNVIEECCVAASKNTTFEDVKRFASKVLTLDYPGGGGRIEKEQLDYRDKNV